MDKNEIDGIIADIIAGEEITDEAKAAFDQWYGSSPENREYFERLTLLRAGGMSGLRFGDIRERVLAIRQRRRLRYYAAAAAVLAIAAVSAMLPLLTEREDGSDTIALNTQKITLTLSNGETVELDGNTSVTDGNSLIKSDENSLVYDDTGAETEQVYYNTLTIPRGCEYTLKLADGTTVRLNSGTEIKYPASYSAATREVYLSGEAYFEVAADPDKPFIVHTGDIDVRVTGTSFNVNAYPDMGSVTATLEKGSVQILDGLRVFEMTPGMHARYDRATRQTELKMTDTRYHTSWKEGYFYFDDMRMEEIMEILARWYDLTPVFTDPDIRDMRFGGRFTRYEDISYLLGKFEETGNIKFEIKGRRVIAGAKE